MACCGSSNIEIGRAAGGKIPRVATGEEGGVFRSQICVCLLLGRYKIRQRRTFEREAVVAVVATAEAMRKASLEKALQKDQLAAASKARKRAKVVANVAAAKLAALDKEVEML